MGEEPRKSKFLYWLPVIVGIVLLLFLIVYSVSFISSHYDEIKQQYEEEKEKDKETLEYINGGIKVYVDPVTGVNYLVFQYMYRGGICVRYNEDGTVFVGGN